jgi:RHS repeat-associated protein
MKTTYAYDEAGFVASVTRPVDAVQGDAVTQYLRDDLGRVVQLTNALGDLTKATYTAPDGTSPGELLTLLEVGATGSARGRRQKLVYDTRGRLLEVQRCTDYASTCGTFKLFRKFGYDSEGNRLWAEDYSEDTVGALVARRTKLFYDLAGRLQKIEDPAAKATQFEYDERGNLTKRTDALSRVTQWAYDGLDRLIQETNAINGITTLGYDAAGNVVRVTDPVGSTTEYAYDGLSRLLFVRQPMGETVQYAWDARDRLAKKVLARSVLGGSSEHPEIRYTYETWGPLQEAKHYAKSSDPTPIKTITYGRNRAGDLVSVTDDAIQATPLYTYEVDKLGRTTKATAKYLPGGDRPIDSVYDARGDRTSMTLTDGSETLTHVYGYAADSGLLTSATFPSSTTALTITRWPHDGVKQITYPGGVHRDVTYDARGPVASIQIYPPSSGTPLESWTYTYTAVLNVDTITDQASRVTDYGYDNLDRLTSADHPAMPAPLNTLPDLETFTYDGVGNRTMSGYAHDANHRMRASPGHTYDYDDDGNLKTQNPGASQALYTWDLSNQLASYSSGSTSASYVYDPFGRRIQKAVGSTVTWFLWNGPTILAEFNGSGVRQRRSEDLGPWTHGQVAIGASLGTEAVYGVHADRLETPKLLTTSGGAVVWRAVHEAFGKAHVDEDPDGNMTPVSLAIRFLGQQLDGETELHYNWFRQYEPTGGRYISSDPIAFIGSMSPYAYALANPLSAVDLLGLLGHHVVPKAVYTGAGVSSDAATVFDAATTGWKPGTAPHGWSKGHKAYNEAVGEILESYLDEAGKEASELTAAEAQAIVDRVLKSQDPAVKEFLDQLSKLLGRNCRRVAGAAARDAARALSAVGAAGGLDTMTSSCLNKGEGYCDLLEGK